MDEKLSTRSIRLGMLTPSSNTVLEPITSDMLSGLEEVSVHFSRFRVKEISLSDGALSQFDNKSLMQAARLLADAKVDVIAWNGTSAGWLGFDTDRLLCENITAALGIPATTSTLALGDAFRSINAKKYGLVTPYLHEIQDKILENFSLEGFHCVSEQHLNDPGNFSFAEVTEREITKMVKQVAQDNPQVITTFCTNLRAAPLVNRLEKDLGIPIFDTVSVVVWKSLLLAGVEPEKVLGWGGLFDQEH